MAPRRKAWLEQLAEEQKYRNKLRGRAKAQETLRSWSNMNGATPESRIRALGGINPGAYRGEVMDLFDGYSNAVKASMIVGVDPKTGKYYDTASDFIGQGTELSADGVGLDTLGEMLLDAGLLHNVENNYMQPSINDVLAWLGENLGRKVYSGEAGGKALEKRVYEEYANEPEIPYGFSWRDEDGLEHKLVSVGGNESTGNIYTIEIEGESDTEYDLSEAQMLEIVRKKQDAEEEALAGAYEAQAQENGDYEDDLPYQVKAKDREYLAAVERGDHDGDDLRALLRDAEPQDRDRVVKAWLARNPETSKKLSDSVDAAAKRAGHNVGPIYHGTAGNFNVFSAEKIGEAFRNDKVGFHFSSSLLDDANDYAAIRASQTGEERRVIAAHLRMENPYTLDDFVDDFYESSKESALDGMTLVEFWDVYKRSILDTLETKIKNGKPIDGVLIEGAGKFYAPGEKLAIVFSPSQIKSADPVTYDDDGNVIPPSERFNADNDDIRFQVNRGIDKDRGKWDNNSINSVDRILFKENTNGIGNKRGLAQDALAATTLGERSQSTSRPPERSKAERDRIVQWAEKEGRLINKIPFRLDGPKDDGGMEHHVFYHAKSKRWIKVTRGLGGRTLDLTGDAWKLDSGTPGEYLERIIFQNEYLGNDIVFHGVYTDRYGNVNLVTSQRDIQGDPVTSEKLNDHLESDGFIPLGDDAWYRREDGMLLLDVHRQNAIERDNKLFLFDVIGKILSEEEARAMRLPLSVRFNDESDDIRFQVQAMRESGQKSHGAIERRRSFTMDAGIQFQVSRKRRKEYEDTLAKSRPELDAKAVMAALDAYDDPKAEKLAMYWTAKGTVIPQEDGDKIRQAIRLSEKHKVDPMGYDSPVAIINAFAKDGGDSYAERLDPATVEEFSDKRELAEHGVVTYEVEDSEAGQAAARRIIDSHWGEDANPWCLLYKDPGTGELNDNAWSYWSKHYPGEKRIAFQHGRLLAFYAGGQWWDRLDHATRGTPVTAKIAGDPLRRKALRELDEDTGALGEKALLVFKGDPNDGEYTEWYTEAQDSAIKKRENRSGGKLHGVLEWYYDSGQLRFRGHFEHGKYHGIREVYYDSGQLGFRVNYENGKYHGIREVYYENGQLKVREHYEHGEPRGVQEEYFDNGQLGFRVNYENGKYHGVWEEYHKNGQLEFRVNYENGKYHGIREVYYENGQLRSREHYEHGELVENPESDDIRYQVNRGIDKDQGKWDNNNINSVDRILFKENTNGIGNKRGLAQDALAATTLGKRSQRTSRPPERSKAERDRIVQWAEKEGRLINKIPFRLDGPKDKGGMEHHAYYHAKSKRWIKVTRGLGGRTLDLTGDAWKLDSGTPGEYLERIIFQNEYLGNDIVFHGVYTDRYGNVNLVTSQRDIQGDPVTSEKLNDHLDSDGFIPLGDDAWYRREDGMLLLDVHTENTIERDNELFLFDVIGKILSDEEARAMRLPLSERFNDESDDIRFQVMGDQLDLFGVKLGAQREQRKEAEKKIEQTEIFDAPKAEPVETPAGRIEDFGEKIGGARKDLYASYRDAMARALGADIATVPLSESWPTPKYQKLIDDGADPYTVAFIRSLREEVPPKPRNRYKLARWVETVQQLRELAEMAMNDPRFKERATEAGPIRGNIPETEATGGGTFGVVVAGIATRTLINGIKKLSLPYLNNEGLMEMNSGGFLALPGAQRANG